MVFLLTWQSHLCVCLVQVQGLDLVDVLNEYSGLVKSFKGVAVQYKTRKQLADSGGKQHSAEQDQVCGKTVLAVHGREMFQDQPFQFQRIQPVPRIQKKPHNMISAKGPIVKYG